MISSRRLAREWALKILYQMDVGGSSLVEARDSALERLRTEFVQRGSRNASGSTAELICLEYVTYSLNDALASVRQPFERAIKFSLEHAFSAVPCWQEACFEKVFKYKFKGHKLRPLHLLPGHSVEPTQPLQEAGTGNDGGLTDIETARLAKFTSDITTQLPLQLAAEVRRTARANVLALHDRRPNVTTRWDSAFEQILLAERIRQNADAVDRWRKVAQIVQKQTADWLRVGCFTARLVNLTDQHRAEIDRMLASLASGWKLDRQVAVDRNILRLAAIEMLFIPEIPFSASINEAVELAKKFSTNESGRFVNGVLGAVAQRIGDKPVIEDRSAAPGDDLIDDVMDSSEIIEVDGVDTLIGGTAAASDSFDADDN